MASNKANTKVITPKAMLSYPHLAEAKAGPDGGTPKFGASLVFLPGTDISELERAAYAAAEEKFGKTWMAPNGQVYPIAEAFKLGVFRWPFRTDGVKKGYPEGSVYINVRSERRPGLVYAWPDPATGKPAIVPADEVQTAFYPGCFVRASIVAFGYDKVGKGVSFSLNNMQKLADGERIDGRAAAQDEFDADLSAAPADLEELIR